MTCYKITDFVWVFLLSFRKWFTLEIQYAFCNYNVTYTDANRHAKNQKPGLTLHNTKMIRKDSQNDSQNDSPKMIRKMIRKMILKMIRKMIRKLATCLVFSLHEIRKMIRTSVYLGVESADPGWTSRTV